MTKVGRKGKGIDQYYLWERWVSGQDPGVFSRTMDPKHTRVWQMSSHARKEVLNRWTKEIETEQLSELTNLAERFNQTERDLSDYFDHGKNFEVLKQKRIIGCTTTGAAKSIPAPIAAKAGVVLVEEAGEILESHILAATTRDTKQLILIGDHKQLRPKINNYRLTVEKGEGYDLNRSMFERLVLNGFPHTTLVE